MASRSRMRTAVWAVAFTVLAGGVALSFATTTLNEAAGPSAGPAPPCPYGYVDHPTRGAGLAHALSSTVDGARLLADLGTTEVRYCFGNPPFSVVSGERLLLLRSGDPAPVLAARVAHLLEHVTHGLPFPDPVPASPDCDALLETALEREAVAYGIEVRVRRSLGEVEPVYEFERAMLAAPEDERSAIIERYLRDHPDGAPNLDALVSGYRARCEG